MTAIPIQIAEAVANEIRSSSIDLVGADVFRSYADWDENFSDLVDPRIDVVFTSHQASRQDSTIELASVDSQMYRPSVDIAIRKRFESQDRDPDNGRLLNTSVDPFVTLLEDIHEFFIDRRDGDVLTTSSLDVSWAETTIMAWVNHKKLRAGLFEGVIRLTFEVTKEI
jgi:hypothetical protein